MPKRVWDPWSAGNNLWFMALWFMAFETSCIFDNPKFLLFLKMQGGKDSYLWQATTHVCPRSWTSFISTMYPVIILPPSYAEPYQASVIESSPLAALVALPAGGSGAPKHVQEKVKKNYSNNRFQVLISQAKHCMCRSFSLLRLSHNVVGFKDSNLRQQPRHDDNQSQSRYRPSQDIFRYHLMSRPECSTCSLRWTYRCQHVHSIRFPVPRWVKEKRALKNK